MNLLGGMLVVLIAGLQICAIIYAFLLLGRLVNANERVATALEIVARKIKDES